MLCGEVFESCDASCSSQSKEEGALDGRVATLGGTQGCKVWLCISSLHTMGWASPQAQGWRELETTKDEQSFPLPEWLNHLWQGYSPGQIHLNWVLCTKIVTAYELRYCGILWIKSCVFVIPGWRSYLYLYWVSKSWDQSNDRVLHEEWVWKAVCLLPFWNRAGHSLLVCPLGMWEPRWDWDPTSSGIQKCGLQEGLLNDHALSIRHTSPFGLL